MLFKEYLVISYLLLFKLCWTVGSDFCRTGRLDSAVRTQNGYIFIFFGQYLLQFSDDLKLKDRNPTPIEKVFRDLNFDKIDASFTADGENNPNGGKTYLISKNVIKEYRNSEPTGLQSRIDQWLSRKRLNSTDLVINQLGDSIAIFFGAVPQRTDVKREYILYDFDSVTQPAMISDANIVETEALIDRPQQNNLQLRSVVGLSNQSYLVLYNAIGGKRVGKYCIAKHLSGGVSR